MTIMSNPIKQLFAAPVFEDEDKTRAAGMLYAILRTLLIVLVVAPILSSAVTGVHLQFSTLLISASGAAAILGMFSLARRGRVIWVGVLLLCALMGVTTFSIVITGGVSNPNPLVGGYIAIIVSAGLVLGGRAAILFAMLSLLVVLGLFYGQTSGTLRLVVTGSPATGSAQLITTGAIFGVTALLLRLAARGINAGLERARQNERAQLEANRELQALQASLEQTIAQRTAQVRVSAEVGRAVTSILDQDELIRQVVQLITDRFNFYYAAVFLIDDEGKFAVLREATGMAGRVLKESGHQLEIGGQTQSVVSAAILQRKPRVYGRASSEPIRFANPLLPDTQSEIALPLVVGDRVFGALNVQGTQPAAFDDSTVAVLQNLADQVAIALNNARQFENAQREARQATALFQASQLAGSISEDLATAASRLLGTVAEQAGFDAWVAVTFDAERNTSTLLAAHVPREASRQAAGSADRAAVGGWPLDAPSAFAIRLRQPVVINEPDIDPLFNGLPAHVRREMGKSISVPALLGDRVVGAITLARAVERAGIGPRDVQLAQAIASQLAVTIENRRLLEQAQTAAAELTVLMRRYTHEGWSRLGQSHPDSMRHEYNRPDAAPLDPVVLPAIDRAALAHSLTPIPFDGQAAIGVPITLRGEVIGTLGVQAEQNRLWTEDELVTLQAVADQVAQSIEVVRLLDETEASLQETTELYHAGHAITAAQTPDDILRAFADHVLAPPLDRCILTLIDPASPPNDPVVEIVASWLREDTPQTLLGRHWKLSDAASRSVHTAEAFVISDVATSPMLADDLRHSLLNEAGVRAQAIVPLLVGARPVGWLMIESTRCTYEFSDREIRLYRTLAGQAAVAIENRRLFEETQRRAEIESTLNHISQTIRASLDPQAVLDLEATVTEMGRVMRASRSFYLTQVGDQGFIYAYEWCAANVPSFKGIDGSWRRDSVPPVFRLLETGQSLVVQNIERDDAPELKPIMYARSVLSHLHVPVLTGHRLIGILGFEQVDRERRWTAEELNMVQRVADQLAVALENARLYQSVRARVNELTALTRIGRRLAATLELEDVLNTIVEEAIHVTPADRGSIALYDAAQDALELRVLIGYSEEARRITKQSPSSGGTEQSPSFGGIDDKTHRLLRRGDGLHGRLLATGRAVLYDDVRNDAADLAVDGDTRSELIVPIKQGGTLLGALNLESPRTHAFGESDQRLIEALADQAAVAIANARAYQAERAAVERMREVDRIKTQFLANMSHELRTPLNSIIGFSRVILRGIDGPLTDLQRADLSAIHNSGQHLLGLINDILDLSKIEAGKMELSIEDVDLADIVKGVLSTAIALVKDKPVELRQELPADLPPLKGDPRRIRQVVLNLVSNAAKFTEQGHVTAHVVVNPREVQISVSDSGSGIPTDKLEHIFEEFTQVDASTTRRVGGTGLGLAISRRFVELHGGRIWAASQIGVGSAFTFTLPLEHPGPAQPAQTPPAASQPDPGQRRVLCIDDDPAVITLYRRYLEKQDFQVIGLQDATQSVEEARRLQPIAITLDVLMPNRDGWSVLADLKSSPDTSRIPIIVCSILEDESKGFALGATDYLVKPITESELLWALGRVNRATTAQTVLVIDDELDAIRLVRRVLEAHSRYRVIEAQGGAHGIASVQAHRPDVVILDLMMPDIDGFAVLETIKSNRLTRDTPVIIVTAKDLTDEDQTRLRGKTAALLNKGMFDSERLLGEIAAALDRIGAAVAPSPHGAVQPS